MSYIFYLRDRNTGTNLKFQNVDRSLHRWKNDQHPKIPNSIQELQSAFEKPEIIDKYGSTYEGNGKFYINTILSPKCDFTVFASPFIMKFIEENIKDRRYLMDGTFDSLPKGFYQMLIISIEYKDDVSKSTSFSCLPNRPPVCYPMRLKVHLVKYATFYVIPRYFRCSIV